MVNTMSTNHVHTRGQPTDREQARALIGQSSLEEKQKGRNPGQRINSGKIPFGAEDFIAVACVVVEEAPFLEPFGHKRVAWEKINQILRDKGFRHHVQPSTIQHKAEALVAHKKDPQSKKGTVCAVAKAFSGSRSAAITIAALVEQMEAQWDRAQDKNDDTRVAIKKKHDADRQGGEAIREASMKTIRKHLRSPSPDSDDGIANIVLAPTPLFVPQLDTSSSPSTPSPPDTNFNIDAAPAVDFDYSADDEARPSATTLEKPKKKKYRVGDRRSAGNDGVLALMRDDSARREKHEKNIERTLNEFVEETKRGREETNSILQGFLEIERS